MPTDHPRAFDWRRALTSFGDPPRWVEITLWVVLAAVVVGIRLYLIQLVPVHLWSKDANSYAAPALSWLHIGDWQTDPRRGPVYSLVIAACLKLWGSFDAVMALQHVLGGCAVLLAVLVLRLVYGRRAAWPVFVCGYAYAVYAAPLHMEHLIRNETLLLLFSTVALGGAGLALRGTSIDARWLSLSGLGAGLLTLTKNVFGPFPLIIIAGVVWLNRSRGSAATKVTAAFAIAFALPFIGAALLQRSALPAKPDEPQAGLLLYSRVVQFTVLDGGIAPEIKQLIRGDVEDYRKLMKKMGEPQHNVPLNRTVIPRLRAHLLQLGQTPRDLNRICRSLAFEAITAHPFEYLLQMLNDLRRLQLKGSSGAPGADDMLATRKIVEQLRAGGSTEIPNTTETLRERENPAHFRCYELIVSTAWLWILPPGFLTSILVTLYAVKTPGHLQLWWIALAGVWWFTMALLSTVASPQDRYLIPVTPIMFWTLSAAVIAGWNKLMKHVHLVVEPAVP